MCVLGVAPSSDDGDSAVERHCDSLIMCIVTTLNEGLRNGGGIGDVLRKPSSTVCHRMSQWRSRGVGRVFKVQVAPEFLITPLV